MICPNCLVAALKTVETFQTPESTLRTKKCGGCAWTFTSVEEISDTLVIPHALRLSKRKDPAGYRKKKVIE